MWFLIFDFFCDFKWTYPFFQFLLVFVFTITFVIVKIHGNLNTPTECFASSMHSNVCLWRITCTTSSAWQRLILNQTQVSYISSSPWAALDLNALSLRRWAEGCPPPRPRAPFPQGHAAGCLPACLQKIHVQILLLFCTLIFTQVAKTKPSY